MKKRKTFQPGDVVTNSNYMTTHQNDALWGIILHCDNRSYTLMFFANGRKWESTYSNVPSSGWGSDTVGLWTRTGWNVFLADDHDATGAK